MCGIAGLFQNKNAPLESLKRAAHTLKHRGPDAKGELWWPELQGGLAHQRLSILDLSPSGAQPMENKAGRYAISFNGEIYNHLSLREELPAQQYRGSSDTETLLHAIDSWGLEKSLEKIEGMFAFALVDKKEKKLYLVRDRLGEKPLYYGSFSQDNSSTFFFASELKAFCSFPDFPRKIRKEAALEMLHHSCISQDSIYEGVKNLLPGHYLCLDLPFQKMPQEKSYWQAPVSFCQDQKHSYSEKLTLLEDTLKKVVREQCLSDVPLGVFLSGGVDSSLIAALMQEHQSGQKSFSIRFTENAYDESPHAEKIAKHIGLNHSTITLEASDALKFVPELPQIYCEPFADSSALPTLLLAQSTRRSVTVALSGDGGDEVFLGYNRYLHGEKALKLALRTPAFCHKILDSKLTEKSLEFFYPQARDKKNKLLKALRTKTAQELYDSFTSQWPGGSWNLHKGSSLVEKFRHADLIHYLPGDILVKVDRAAMRASLETRAPYLDRRIINAVTLFSEKELLQGKIGKKPLLDLLAKRFPREYFQRPKTGFAVPLESWLRKDLKSWGEELKNEADKIAADTPYFPIAEFQRLWQEHQQGKNHAHILWNFLQFLSWKRHWKASGH